MGAAEGPRPSQIPAPAPAPAPGSRPDSWRWPADTPHGGDGSSADAAEEEAAVVAAPIRGARQAQSCRCKAIACILI